MDQLIFFKIKTMLFQNIIFFNKINRIFDQVYRFIGTLQVNQVNSKLNFFMPSEGQKPDLRLKQLNLL